MFQAEYIRDMHNKYLVLAGLKENMSGYGVKMLLNNTIPGFLKAELRCIDQMDLFYYDITSFMTIDSVYCNKSIGYDEMKHLLSSILDTLERGGEYLLSENDFIIKPEYIYIDTASGTVSLCHLVGHQENVQEQLSNFFEYLMNRVDYKEERAVLLIYAMYKVSKDTDCTFQKLLAELNKNFRVDAKADSGNHKEADKSEHKPDKGDLDRRKIATGKGNKANINTNDRYEKNKKRARILDTGEIEKRFKIPYSIKAILQDNNLPKNRSKKGPANYDSGSRTVNDIPEEIENDREIPYYGSRTYLLAVASIFTGITVMIAAAQTKFLHNSFGTHIDITKLLCLLIIIGMVEILVMTRLFDRKNQLTRMETNIEYMYPSESESAPEMTAKETQEETEILWVNNEGYEEGRTCILAELNPGKCYCLESVNPVTHNMAGDKIRVDINYYPFLIGKSAGNADLIIEEDSVSRIHARLTSEGEDIFITDLSSTNGTYVNGNRLEKNIPYRLSANDEISFSNISYRWKEKLS